MVQRRKGDFITNLVKIMGFMLPISVSSLFLQEKIMGFMFLTKNYVAGSKVILEHMGVGPLSLRDYLGTSVCLSLILFLFVVSFRVFLN